MADQNQPGFTVVDKRHAAQPSDAQPDTTAEEPAVSPAAEPETTSTPEQTPPAGRSSEDSHEDIEPEAEPFADSDSGPNAGGMPDPSFLIGMAAMQMDAREFMGSLITAFDALALRALGLYANPITGEAEKNLPYAQLAIDAIQFLIGKLEAGMPSEERLEAQRRLSFLRMNYLSKLREE